MIAMVGAYLGLDGAPATIVLRSVAGSIIGLAYINLTKQDASSFQLPFATFLGAEVLLVAQRPM